MGNQGQKPVEHGDRGEEGNFVCEMLCGGVDRVLGWGAGGALPPLGSNKSKGLILADQIIPNK